MTINAATATLQDIREVESTKELVEFYNSIVPEEKRIKKFSNRAEAENRVWKLIQSLPPEDEKPTKRKAPVKERKLREMNFRFAPEAPTKIRLPREGSIRSEVFKVIDTPQGATFDQITARLRVKKKNNMYECLRLIHFQCGMGLWHWRDSSGNTRVRTVRTKDEYMKLLNEAKAAR